MEEGEKGGLWFKKLNKQLAHFKECKSYSNIYQGGNGPFTGAFPLLKPDAVFQGLCCFVGVLKETHIWKRYWHLKYFRLQETAVLGWPCHPYLCQMI